MDYAYGYPAMDKRRAPGRPSLQDYLKLAALQYELDSEEAENEIVPNEGMKMKSIFNWQKALHIFHLLIIFAFFWYFFKHISSSLWQFWRGTQLLIFILFYTYSAEIFYYYLFYVPADKVGQLFGSFFNNQ